MLVNYQLLYNSLHPHSIGFKLLKQGFSLKGWKSGGKHVQQSGIRHTTPNRTDTTRGLVNFDTRFENIAGACVIEKWPRNIFLSHQDNGCFVNGTVSLHLLKGQWYLQGQKRKVEEAVNVFQSEAVHHGRLGVLYFTAALWPVQTK